MLADNEKVYNKQKHADPEHKHLLNHPSDNSADQCWSNPSNHQNINSLSIPSDEHTAATFVHFDCWLDEEKLTLFSIYHAWCVIPWIHIHDTTLICYLPNCNNLFWIHGMNIEICQYINKLNCFFLQTNKLKSSVIIFCRGWMVVWWMVSVNSLNSN